MRASVAAAFTAAKNEPVLSNAWCALVPKLKSSALGTSYGAMHIMGTSSAANRIVRAIGIYIYIFVGGEAAAVKSGFCHISSDVICVVCVLLHYYISGRNVNYYYVKTKTYYCQIVIFAA